MCDICGGKLQGKPSGLFECDSCGMEHSTEWAKAKVQEIRGSVTVEGTVQVQGTAKVEGPVKVEGGGPDLESLLKRAREQLKHPRGVCYKDEAFLNTIDKLLDVDATCPKIYILRLLRKYSLQSVEQLVSAGFKSGERLERCCFLCRG